MSDHERDAISETFGAAELIQRLIEELNEISSSKGQETEAELAHLFKKYSKMIEEQSGRMPGGEMQTALSVLASILNDFENGAPTELNDNGAYQAARSFINAPHIRMFLSLSADFDAMALISRMMQHINLRDVSVPNDFPEDIQKDFRRLIRDSADMRKQADAWCAIFLARGDEIPKMFKEYLIAKTTGTLPQLPRGTNKRAKIIRNHVISHLIQLLHEKFSIPRENHTGGISACSIVAECLGEIGINMGESAVRKCASTVSGATIFDLVELAQPDSAGLLDAIRKDLKITFP